MPEYTVRSLGVWAGKFLGMRKIFSRISSKLPEKYWATFYAIFMWFWAKFFKSKEDGRYFHQIKARWAPFLLVFLWSLLRFSGIFQRFLKIFPRFPLILPGFSPNQKMFAPAPPPPTPLCHPAMDCLPHWCCSSVLADGVIQHNFSQKWCHFHTCVHGRRKEFFQGSY